MRIRKLLSIILIIISILIVNTAVVNAGQLSEASSPVMLITLQDAQRLAIQKSNSLAVYDKNIEKLIKPYVGDEKYLSSTAKFSPLEDMDSLYDRLIKQQAMSVREQGELLMYYSMYEATEYVQGKSLKGYIIKDNFLNSSVWYNLVSLKISKEIARYQIIDQVRQLFDNILTTRREIAIQKEELRIKEKAYNNAVVRFKKGLISELDSISSETDYLTKKLQLKKQERVLQNLEYNFKNTLGVASKQDIELIPYKTRSEYKLSDCDSYIKKALAQRNEITIPKMKLVDIANQLRLINLYLMYLPFDDTFTNMKTINEFENMDINSTIKDQQYKVSGDVISEYVQLTNKKNSFDIKLKELKIAASSYDNAKIRFRNGNINAEALDNAEVSWMRAEAACDNLNRQMDYSLDRMDAICGLGIK